MDTILFSLLILRGMSDSHGRMWRCHPAQLYAIEVSVPDSKVYMCVIVNVAVNNY